MLGKELSGFEDEYALFSNTAYCIGVANGLDALYIALKACGVGPGDEVIVPSHTFLATWLSVIRTGARVVPVEPDPFTYNINKQSIDAAITEKTKAVIPVHLYGQACEMTSLMDLKRLRGIAIIEDNAQAHGATWNGKITGGLGDIGATSFYPIKNLGALGDAGALVTQNGDLAQYARHYRNYGFESKNLADIEGVNSRLDEIQAAVLRIKLKYLASWNDERVKLATSYLQSLKGVADIQLPHSHPQATHVYHLFVIRTDRRNELQSYLASHQIETGIHYPVPPHLQKGLHHLGFRKGEFPVAESIADGVLSLPLWPGMEVSDVEFVCDSIRKFFGY